MSQTTLTSSVEQVCPGNAVTFTCTTVGSSTLVWQSQDYIGSGSQFEFRSIDSIGTSQSNPNAAANLTDISTSGMLTLTSTLRIIARSTPPNVSVSCRNVGLGETNTSTIPLAGT